ncbi:MAG: serine/threonine protein kinase [Candidatus Dadabacteria bacterium]|nr:MAG: serine/threonine protein kinase [Candidatus Dadabacteria bacterium]
MAGLTKEQIKGELLFASRYRIIKRLGAGGMGEVFLALDTLLKDEKVALKILRDSLVTGEHQVSNFLKEAQLNRKVIHPNIVRTYEIGKEGEIIFLTMEYIEGPSLQEKLRGSKLPLQKAIIIFKQILKGLSAIHEANIIHKDLKPSNILIEAGGEAKIADFGIAETVIGDITDPIELAGCADFIAPEVWLGKPATPQSDIYSLGIILYRMLSGKYPFDTHTVTDLMRQHIYVEPPEITGCDIPTHIKALLRKMLEKKPELRPLSCMEILHTLNATSEPDSYTAPTVLPKATTPTSFRKPARMPDYSPLKHKTNPKLLAKKSASTHAKKAGIQIFGASTKNAFYRNTKSPLLKHVASSGISLLAISAALWTLTNYLLPNDRLILYSFKEIITFRFIVYFVILFLSTSFIISFPVALFSSISPRTNTDKPLLATWLDGASVIMLCSLALFAWDLFTSTSDLFGVLLRHPSQVYNSFMRALDSLVSVGLLLPRYSFNLYSMPYYAALVFYIISVFAIFETSPKRKNAFFILPLLLFSALLFIEYLTPVFFTDTVYHLTATKTILSLGEFSYTLSLYSLYCSVINWGVLMVTLSIKRLIVD